MNSVSDVPQPLRVSLMFPTTGKTIDWPHSSVPRVGENICLAVGENYSVIGVSYNRIDPKTGFTAVVQIEPK